MIFIYFFCITGSSSALFYTVCGFMGFGMGYWAIFVTVAAEQFGTNLRATVATTVPNFARGFLVPLTFLFTELTLANVSVVATGCLLTVICFGFAFLAVWKMEETYGKDLDYLEIQLVRSMTGEGTFNLAKETPE
jgi:putative MFS transporter